MIKIDALRTFAAVARAGSLAAGAEMVGRTPSAVSMALRQLEDTLGQPLFETDRKNKLTALGAFALEMAEREIAHFERTVDALTDHAAARAGEVRIAGVPSFSCTVLSGVACEFLESGVDVRFDIRDMDTGSILRELERGRIDMGIVSDAEPSAEFERRTLATDAFGAILREDHPLAERDALAMADLAATPLIDNPLSDRISEPTLRAALARARLRARSTTTLLAMVRAGSGVTLLPEMVLREAAPGLAFRPLADASAIRRIDLLTGRRITPLPAAAAFADFLVARCAELMPSDAQAPSGKLK